MKSATLEEIIEIDGLQEAAGAAVEVRRYLRLVSRHRDWGGLVSKGVAGAPELAATDSIGLAAAIPTGTVHKVVDIGSGAGLLGIVVAIMRPDLDVCLAEASRRKAAFLAETVGALAIENATVFPGRAEELDDDRFDAAMSRASGNLEVIAPLAMRLLKRGGVYIALKGLDAELETEQSKERVQQASGRLIGIVEPEHQKAGATERRSLLVVIRKM